MHANTASSPKFLLICQPSLLERAIRKQARARGWDVTRADPDDDDLFARAVSRSALIYLAAPELLAARLHPRPDVSRVKRVLSASNAPGVELLVAAFPEGEAYAEEVTAIRRYGKAYQLVELPVLLEEIGRAVRADAVTRLWLPSNQVARAAGLRRAARVVLNATQSELHGTTLQVRGKRMSAPELMQRASASVGVELSVHGVPAALHRRLRPVARWLKGREPRAFELVDRLCEPDGDPLAIVPGPSMGPPANESRDSAA